MLLRIKALKNGTSSNRCCNRSDLAFGHQGLECRSDPVVSWNILLQLAPSPHKRNGPQIIEVQGFLVAPFGRPAADIGFAVKFQRAFVFQVGNEHGVVFEGRVLLEAQLGQLRDHLAVFPGNRIFFFKQARRQPGGQQLFAIMLEMGFGAVHAGNRLALNGELDGMIGNILPMRRIKAMGFAAPPRGRPAPAVKEDGLDTVVTANRRQGLLGGIDRPVGLQIPAVFGAVGKPQHDGLPVPALSDMRPVLTGCQRGPA